MSEVTRIGKCSMCQQRAVLVDLACQTCRKKYGPRCGHIANEIRTNPSFAQYAYDVAKKNYDPKILPTFEEFFGKLAKVEIIG